MSVDPHLTSQNTALCRSTVFLDTIISGEKSFPILFILQKKKKKKKNFEADVYGLRFMTSVYIQIFSLLKIAAKMYFSIVLFI